MALSCKTLRRTHQCPPVLPVSDKIARNGSGVRHQISACQTPCCLLSIMAFVRTSPTYRREHLLVEITAGWMFIHQQPGYRGGRSPSAHSRESLLGCPVQPRRHVPVVIHSSTRAATSTHIVLSTPFTMNKCSCNICFFRVK